MLETTYAHSTFGSPASPDKMDEGGTRLHKPWRGWQSPCRSWRSQPRCQHPACACQGPQSSLHQWWLQWGLERKLA